MYKLKILCTICPEKLINVLGHCSAIMNIKEEIQFRMRREQKYCEGRGTRKPRVSVKVTNAKSEGLRNFDPKTIVCYSLGFGQPDDTQPVAFGASKGHYILYLLSFMYIFQSTE